MEKALVEEQKRQAIQRLEREMQNNLFNCLHKWGQLPLFRRVASLQPFFQLHLGAHILKSMKIFNVHIVGKFEFKEPK